MRSPSTHEQATDAPIPRTVLDCSVFVQAFFGSSGPASACLKLAEADEVRLLISLDVLAEIRDVLGRPELSARRLWITPDRVQAFLDRVVRLAELIDPVPHRISYERDPKDEPYLNLAIASRAACLVSRDKDLLDLASGADRAHEAVLQSLGETSIVDPVEFLEAVRKT